MLNMKDMMDWTTRFATGGRQIDVGGFDCVKFAVAVPCNLCEMGEQSTSKLGESLQRSVVFQTTL